MRPTPPTPAPHAAPNGDARPVTPGYLTEREAAAFLSLAPETLRTWRARRTGPPYVKLGGRAVRYPVAGLRQWADGAATTAGSAGAPGGTTRGRAA